MDTIYTLYAFLKTYWIYLVAFYQSEKKQRKSIDGFRLLGMLALYTTLAALFYELYQYFIYYIRLKISMPFIYIYFLSSFFSIDVDCIAYFCVIAITSSPHILELYKGIDIACDDLFGDWDIFIADYIIGIISGLILISIYCICDSLGYNIPISETLFFCKDTIFGLLMASVIPIQAYWEEKLYRQVVHTMLDSIWYNIIPIFFDEKSSEHFAASPYKMYINALLSGLYFATLHIPTFGTIPLMQYVMLLSVHWSMGYVWGIIYEETKNLGASSGMHFMHNFWVITSHPIPQTITGLRTQRPYKITLPDVAVRYTTDAFRGVLTYGAYRRTKDIIEHESSKNTTQDYISNNILSLAQESSFL